MMSGYVLICIMILKSIYEEVKLFYTPDRSSVNVQTQILPCRNVTSLLVIENIYRLKQI